jgi:hypothetical protein
MSLKQVRQYALSDKDIRDILGDVPIFTSRDLGSVQSADSLFDSKGRCVILYTPQSPTEGHWTCLLKKPNGIYFFDSYGDKPDNDEALGDVPPYLTKLLKGSGKPVYYNTKQYQKERNDVATCGRHIISRLIYANKSPEQYDKIVKQFEGTPDDFVSGLIYSFIKK